MRYVVQIVSQYFSYTFCSLVANCPVSLNTLGAKVTRLCKDAEIEGHFTKNSLLATSSTLGLQKGIPDTFLMKVPGIGMSGFCKNINGQIVQVRLRYQRIRNCEAVSVPESVKKGVNKTSR